MSELRTSCPCCSGEGSYIFASYCHEDSALVYPMLQRLHREGCRIWYDDGINPGDEWAEEIARALTNATLFVVFISPDAIESQSVRDEITFALRKRRKFLAVHLVRTALPSGLELQIGRFQALLKYMNSEEEFWAKLMKVVPPEVVVGHEREPSASQEAVIADRTESQEGEIREMSPGGIFLSYASEDAIAARKLRIEFEKASLLVWMDESGPWSGSKWRKTISDNIDKSAVFIPLISVHTGSYGFFREEWERGITRSRLFRTPFLFPVVIDDANIEEIEDIPDEFKEAQVARCRDGVPTKRLMEAVATAQKMNQKAKARA